MTAMQATPLDLIAIRQHILSELGVVAWALKTDEISINPKTYQSRLHFNQQSNTIDNGSLIQNHPIIEQHIVSNLKTNTPNTNLSDVQTSNNHEQLSSQKTLIQNEHKINLPSIKTNHAPQHSSSPPVMNAPLPELFVGMNVTSEQFNLSGIAYQDWVILADNAFMNANQKSIWHSLADKLTAKGALFLQVHYPLVVNEYHEYENFSQGTHSLLGFLLRLCANKSWLKLALLTPLSDGIELGHLNTYHHITPTLAQMAEFAEHKKTFWQLLHN